MGTRSILARYIDAGFEGRYVHWDGYPGGVGRTLFSARAEFGSTERVTDWALRPGQEGYWSSFGTPSEIAATTHPEEHFWVGDAGDDWLTILPPALGDDMGTEWAYVIDGDHFDVWCNYWQYGWARCARVFWNLEPDWGAIEELSNSRPAVDPVNA